MKKKIVLITGALTGIGRATAIGFARDGACVVVSGRRGAAGEELAKELRVIGTEAEFVLVDVRNEDEVRNLVEKTVARFGALDVAVNNAGTEGHPGPVTDQSIEGYQDVFDTNVLGTLLSMKYEMRVMQRQGHGSIVNISSTFGKKGGAGSSVYSASKHAVEGLTKSAALEGASTGVRVNAVAPGPIDTDMVSRLTGNDANKATLVAGVPLKRLGRPDEVAQTILFLTSDKAPFITGQIIGIDGGKMA